MKSSPNSNRFYDQLAPVYHLKVDWQHRASKEDRLFELLTRELQPACVLDIGCGDGGHAARYAAVGAQYLGIDKSPAMIRAAKRTHGQSPNATFRTGDMTKLPVSFAARFNQVVILGNTIPHLTTLAALTQAFAGMSRSLIDGGHLVLQTVNPHILAGKKLHLLPPKLTQDTLFVPFYLKRGECWEFVMQIFKVSRVSVTHRSAATTMLRFWSRDEIKAVALANKLRLVASYGDAGLSSYKPQSSDNMILLFRKKAHAGTSRS